MLTLPGRGIHGVARPPTSSPQRATVAQRPSHGIRDTRILSHVIVACAPGAAETPSALLALCMRAAARSLDSWPESRRRRLGI